MTAITPATTDNRRAIVRIVAYEIMRLSTSMARVHDGDVIEYLVFTAMWVLNTQHLIGHPLYGELKNIPPDAQRKPATLDDLRRTVPMPEEILQAYVERLLTRGYAEERSGGLVVPSAVFTQPDMLDGANELYSHVVTMVQSMRAAGFSFGEQTSTIDQRRQG